MRKFSSILIVSVTALAAVTASSGCKKKSKNKPEDTVVGTQASRSDWVNDSSSYSEKLEERASSNLTGSEIEQFAHKKASESFFFAFDNSSISANEKAKMPKLIEALEADSKTPILVVGHCDWRGTQEYNLALGDRRAKSIESYLMQMGVSQDRIKTLSRGSLEAKTEGSESEWQYDRRADVILMK